MNEILGYVASALIVFAFKFGDDRELELIGNIYENPELLDEVEE